MGGERCADCEGRGELFVHDFQDGFERRRRWETCERCGGSGYEPKPEEDEEDASDCHTAG